MDGANGKRKSYKTAKPKAPSNAASFPEKHKPQALEYRTPDGLPGVNKIKASIRQTTRLLKKVGRASTAIPTEKRHLQRLQSSFGGCPREELIV